MVDEWLVQRIRGMGRRHTIDALVLDLGWEKHRRAGRAGRLILCHDSVGKRERESDNGAVIEQLTL